MCPRRGEVCVLCVDVVVRKRGGEVKDVHSAHRDLRSFVSFRQLNMHERKRIHEKVNGVWIVIQ